MMQCYEVRAGINDLLDEQLPAMAAAAVRSHLRACPHCQERYADQQRLRAALRALPPALPSPGFESRVLQAAAARARPAAPAPVHWRPGLALAATLVLGIGVGFYLGQPSVISPALDPVPRVSMTVEQVHEVELAFDSGIALADVTVTLHLPESVELAGYPGQRSIQWRTDLAAGRNRLSLPVVAQAVGGGLLVAELAHGNSIKRFELRLDVSSRTGALAPGRTLGV